MASRRLIGILSTLALLSLALSGCSLLEPAPPRQSWKLESQVIGQPVIADGVAIAYRTLPSHALQIIGVDAAKGTLLWQHAASPGYQPSGISLTPLVAQNAAGRKVAVYLRPSTGEGLPTTLDDTNLVAADLRTGKDLSVSAAFEADMELEPCSDGRDACVDGWRTDDLGYEHLRFDIQSGALSPQEDDGALPDGAFGIGPHGLYVVSDGEGVQKLGVELKGRIAWQRPAGEIFGPGYSTDYGWDWDYSKALNLFVGSIGAEDRGDDMTRTITVAIDGDTGEVRWKLNKLDPDCNNAFPIFASNEHNRLTVGCLYRGALEYEQNKFSRAPGFSTTLVGYDPSNGHILWKTPAGSSMSLLFSDVWRGASGTNTHVMPIGRGAASLDVATGKLTPLTASDSFLCVKKDDFAYVVPYANGISNHSGGTLFADCNSDFTPRKKFILSPDDAEALALPDDDPGVIAIPGALVGFSRD